MKIITVIKTLTLALILSGCGKGMISLQDELTAQEQLQMEKEELKEFIQVQNCAGNEVFNVDINIEETYDLCAVRKRYTGQSVGYEDVTWSIYDSESIGVLSSYYGPMTTFTALASGESRILASATTLLFDYTGYIKVATEPPTKFIIVPPDDSYVNTSTAIRIEARDRFDTIVPTYDGRVKLLVNKGTVSGAGTVTIAKGFGTMDLIDTVAETVVLTLEDSGGTSYNVTSTEDIIFSLKPPVRFVITEATSATTSSPSDVTIQAQNIDGEVVTNYTLNDVITLTTSGNAVGGGTLDFTNGVARAIIADTTGEVVNLELTDSGQTGLDVTNDAYDLVSPSLPAGVQSIDFRAFPTKYVITSAPDTYIRTATVVRIEARDVNNAMMTTYSGVVTLSATGSATGEGQVTITAGFGTKSLLDNVAETVNLSLSAASDDLDVSNSGGDSTIVFSYKPVAKFKITNAPDTLQTQNTTITIEAQDEDNNRVPDYTLSSAVRLTTSGSATGGGMLNFTAGLATKVITDAVAETVNLGFSNPVNPAINITNTGGDPNVVFGAFPTKYVITSVPDSYVNNATTVTIQAQDALGVKVGLYSGSVTLNVQGPATGGGVVTIIAGQGTIMVNDAVEQLVGLSLSTPSPDALDVSNVSGRQNVRFSYRPLTIVVPALGSSYSNSSILNTLDDSLLADNGTTSDDYVGKYDINSGSAERALIQVIIKNKNVVAQGETGTVDILIIGTDDKVRKAYLGNDAVVDSSNNTVVSDIAIPMYPGEGLLFKNNVVGAGISMGAHADGVRVVGAIDVGDTVPSRTTEAPQAVYDLATPTVTPITATGACDINAPIAVARGPGFYSWEDTLTCTASSYSFNLYLVDHVGSTTLTLTQGGNETIRTFTIARKNYFGSGADGALTVTTLTQLAVSGGANAYDGDMVVKNYTNLTIVNGGELTVASPARGLLIYVSGNLTVNGKISMTGKGALIDPVDAGVLSTGLRFLRMKSGSSETHGGSELDGSGATSILAEARQPESVADGKFYVIARQGSAGGASISADGVGLTGVGSAAGKAGGGGGGATFGGIGGSGSAGTCFSGGSGGGAGYNGVGSDASLYGGEGGLCTANTNSAGGGAGNPGGGLCGAGTAPQSGTGGLLVIIVKGTTVIGATGIIEANGMLGGSADVGGGGSGGGNILILHGGAYTNNGALRVLGGSGGTGGTYSGGTGGAGYSSVDLIDQ